MTNIFKPIDNNYKDSHSVPKWIKINRNKSNNLNEINIIFREVKVVNIS